MWKAVQVLCVLTAVAVFLVSIALWGMLTSLGLMIVLLLLSGMAYGHLRHEGVSEENAWMCLGIAVNVGIIWWMGSKLLDGIWPEWTSTTVAIAAAVPVMAIIASMVRQWHYATPPKHQEEADVS